MAIVIQPGLNPTRPLTHARIGHATITRTGTLSASGEQADFEADAALNELTYEFWKADALRRRCATSPARLCQWTTSASQRTRWEPTARA